MNIACNLRFAFSCFYLLILAYLRVLIVVSCLRWKSRSFEEEGEVSLQIPLKPKLYGDMEGTNLL